MLQNTQDFNVINADEKVDVADWRMSSYGLSSLVVIKDRRPVGRITRVDVLEAQERHVEALVSGEELQTVDLTLDRLFSHRIGGTTQGGATGGRCIGWAELLSPSAGCDLAA